MKRLLHIILIATAVLCVASCSKKKTSHSAEAQSRAQKVAQKLAAADKTDTVAMQAILIEQEGIRSEYELADDKEAAEEFDATFRAALNQQAPELAKAILH